MLVLIKKYGMNMKLKAILLFFFIVFSPLSSHAQGFENLRDLVSELYGFFNLLVGFLIGLAVVLFFWGMVRYIGAGDDSSKIEAGRKLILWGLLGIFIMISMWGIITVFVYAFGFDVGSPNLPIFPGDALDPPLGP